MRGRHQIAALAAFAVLIGAPAAQAWQQSTSSKGAKLHWTDPCQVIYAHEIGSADVADDTDIAAIQASLETWNAVECSAFTFLWGGLTNMAWAGYSSHGENASIVIFREDNWPYEQRPVAFTSVTYNPVTGVILDADIEMNAEDYSFTTGGPDKLPGDIDIQNTLTHEAGHIFGLEHSDDIKATMYASSIFGETLKRTLDKDDEDGVCTIYPAEDGAEACQEVARLDLWVEDPDSPPGPASNPSCAVGGARAAAGAWVLFAAAGMLLLRRRRTI